MKVNAKIIALYLLLAHGATASIPWNTIEKGQAYWQNTLDFSNIKAANSIPNTEEIKPHQSLRIINAVLRYQIDRLSNAQLKRFADSNMHVLMFLSGASPIQPDQYNRGGWWHLSYPVAMRYGLQVTPYIDERNNFEKSTKAAMNYVKDLQKNHQEDWVYALITDPLVAARATRNQKQQMRNDLDNLYRIMVLSSFSQQEDYAVKRFYEQTSEYKTDAQILTDLIVERSGISKKDFYALNPEIVGDVIPAKYNMQLTKLALAQVKLNQEDIELLSESRLADNEEKLAAKKARIKSNTPDPATYNAMVYKVKSGDNLGFIAEKYSVGVSQIKAWNKLRSDRIYVGQRLTIYQKKETKNNIASAPKKKEEVTNRQMAVANTNAGSFILYKVKTGDTLWSIARKFPGVSPDNLMTWNSITPNINVGQEIKVKKSVIRNYSPTVYPDRL